MTYEEKGSNNIPRARDDWLTAVKRVPVEGDEMPDGGQEGTAEGGKVSAATNKGIIESQGEGELRLIDVQR